MSLREIETEMNISSNHVFYLVKKNFEQTNERLERLSQAVRMDANYFRTAYERSRNGKPFGNGKPLVYVFA